MLTLIIKNELNLGDMHSICLEWETQKGRTGTGRSWTDRVRSPWLLAYKKSVSEDLFLLINTPNYRVILEWMSDYVCGVYKNILHYTLSYRNSS